MNGDFRAHGTLVTVNWWKPIHWRRGDLIFAWVLRVGPFVWAPFRKSDARSENPE